MSRMRKLMRPSPIPSRVCHIGLQDLVDLPCLFLVGINANILKIVGRSVKGGSGGTTFASQHQVRMREITFFVGSEPCMEGTLCVNVLFFSARGVRFRLTRITEQRTFTISAVIPGNFRCWSGGGFAGTGLLCRLVIDSE